MKWWSKSSSATVIDMSVGADAKRLAIATASGVLGRAIKLKVLPGGVAQAAPTRPQPASNGGGRARAEQDPIVRRLQEKFGAEIRTIIDQSEKEVERLKVQPVGGVHGWI